ncbi:MAG: hypothetical protein ACRCW0_02490 [Clostridium sp.]
MFKMILMRILDGLCCVLLYLFLITLILVAKFAASDKPVVISFSEVISISIGLIIFLILHTIYMNFSKLLVTPLLLNLFHLGLWFIDMQDALKYHHHLNDTRIGIIGFTITLVAFFHIAYNIFKKYMRKDTTINFHSNFKL